MPVGELQFRVVCRPPHRKHREQSPPLHSLSDKEIANGWQLVEIVFSHTSHDIEDDGLLGCHQVDGFGNGFKATLVTAHPVMVFLQSVEADGYGMETGSEQRAEALGSE